MAEQFGDDIKSTEESGVSDTGQIEKTRVQEGAARELAGLKGLIEEARAKYFTPEANELVKRYESSIETQSTSLFEKLGLDPKKIGIVPSTFLENMIRREQAYVNWGDKTQAGFAWLASKIGYVNDNGSIGPLQINPGTYREARIANGLQDITDSELVEYLLKPESALEACAQVLKTLLPQSGEPIQIGLNRKDGNGVVQYKLAPAGEYLFKTRSGQSVSYTHEELRLLTAVGKYQGSGLRLFSPDVEAPVDAGAGTITKTDDLILNNEITFTLGID